MKRILLITITILLAAGNSRGQCNADHFRTTCIPQLASGFNFLKGYKLDGKGGELATLEYSYVFTKGTDYMINICTASSNGIVINLFDSKRNQVASSKIGDELASAIAFPCKSTSLYYIRYSFDEGSDFCGGSALGFKKSRG